MKVEVIGAGSVGKAIGEALIEYGNEVVFKDSNPEVVNQLESQGFDAVCAEENTHADLSAICVPTPYAGSTEHNIVFETLVQLEVSGSLDGRAVSIHSTVLPGTTAKLQEEFNLQRIARVPEFMKESEGAEYILNQDSMLIGVNSESTFDVLTEAFDLDADLIKCTPEEASMVKYMSNLFAMTKISFANEMWRISSHINGADPDRTESYFKRASPWVGQSGICQKGLSGGSSFGGSCFPKDIQTFIQWCRQNKLYPAQTQGTLEENLIMGGEDTR